MSEVDNVEHLRAAHVLEGVSQSLSTDGQAAMLVFKIAGAIGFDKFAITVATGGLKSLRAMVNDLIDQAEKRAAGKSMVPFKRPQDVSVGHSPHLRGCVILTFDSGRETEAAYLMPDQIGLEIGTAMTKDVMSRMTEADRRKMMARSAPVLMPPGPKIIFPCAG